MKPFTFLLFLSVVLLTACPGTDLPPAAPQGLSATPGNSQLTLSWKANSEDDVRAYTVSWQIQGQQAQSKDVGLETTTVLDKLQNGLTYSLTVTAEDKGGKKSPPSAAITGTPVGTTAPGPDTPNPQTPTAPATPAGLQAVAQDSQVTLTWTANKETDLRQYRVLWGTAEGALTQSQLVPAPATGYIVRGLTNGTNYFFALEVENIANLVSPRSTAVNATPQFVPLAPAVSDIAITVTADGNKVDLGLSNQVRQGMGVITLTIKGSSLESLKTATLGTLPLTIVQKQADGAKLEGNIAHGAALGEQILLLENDAGSVSVEEAVEVTKITSQEDTFFKPSDTCTDPSTPGLCGLGTPNRPFRTLTKALSMSSAGDTIYLGDGNYSAGETWPASTGGFPPVITPNVPAGVTIEGQSPGKDASGKDNPPGVTLRGPANTSASSALVFADSATVRNVRVTEFDRALVHIYTDQGTSGEFLFENLAVAANFDGFLDFGASFITVRNSKFSNNGNGVIGSGIATFNSNGVSIENSTFESNTYGIYGVAAGAVWVNNTTVTKSFRDGIYLTDVYSSSLQNVTSSGNTGNGVYVANNDAYDFRMRGGVLSDNRKSGIEIAGNELGQWNLGTATDSGNNTLENNTLWQLFDNRAANTGNTIQAKGNTLNGQTLTGVRSQTDNSAGLPNLWQIAQPGNSIEF
jgi:hypothetical protein